MKRGHLIALFFALLIVALAGCNIASDEAPAPAEAEPIQPAVIEPGAVELPAEEPGEVEVVVVESRKPENLPNESIIAPPTKSLDPEIAAMLDNAKLVRSYQYNYRGPPDRVESADAFVKDNHMKMVYVLHRNVEKPELRYNTVYFDTAAKELYAYCEQQTKCYPIGNRPGVQLDYDAEYRLTPMEWYNRMVEAEKIGEQTFDRVKVIGIKFNFEGREVKAWINSLYGLPQLVEDGDKRYEYTAMAINRLTAADVVP